MSKLGELAHLDATAQADLVRRKEVKPIDLVEGGGSLAPEPERPKPAAVVPEPARRKRPNRLGQVILIVGALFICGLLALFVLLSGRTEATTGEVRGVYWERSIVVEEILPVEYQTWEDQIPAEGQILGCQEELRSIQAAFEKTLAGEFEEFELTFMRKDGSRFPALLSPSCVRGEAGRVRFYLATVKDIGEVKRREEELRESEEMNRALVETSRDWIWAIDLQAQHTYSNPAIKDILGYEPQKIVGGQSLELMHEEDRKRIEDLLPRWIEEQTGWNNLILRWRHKEDGYRYLESNAVPVFDAEGELSGFRGVDRDITETGEPRGRGRE